MSKLFNIQDQSRTNRAYKVYIEPYDSINGSAGFLGYSEMDKIVKEKLTLANAGYKKQWNKDLISGNKIDWNEATVIADNEDESSLSFNYGATWEQSKLTDVIGDFIPSGVTLGIGRALAKGATAGAKLVTGGAAYHGTFPALNLNERKLMAKPTYLSYNLKLKVVDKNGDGEVIRMLTKLLIYTVPQTTVASVSTSTVINASKKMVNEGIKIGINILTDSPYKADPTDKVDAQGKVITSPPVPSNTETNINAAAQLVFGLTPNVELISTPVPLRIFVSDYYVHNLCVIESLAVNLSKQINSAGYPVYGTFDLSISSRELTPLDLGVDAASSTPSTLRNIIFASTLKRVSPACLDDQHQIRADNLEAQRAAEEQAALQAKIDASKNTKVKAPTATKIKPENASTSPVSAAESTNVKYKVSEKKSVGSLY